MSKVQCVRGTYDLYGTAKRKMKKVAAEASSVVEKYGFEEIETPIFEFTEVFARNLGDTSDIVTKEMYCFNDKGGESLTLRPEGTAGVVRAFVSNGMQQNLPVKFYYTGPMFRYERPQKGRQRQFTQFGVELLGVETPQADIEVISMAYEFLEKLGLSGQVVVEINSLGDAESRDAYRAELVAYLKEHYDELSEDSKNRLERNPLRVLDSKEECDRAVVENAPLYADSLNETSKEFFAKVLHGLDLLGIKYRVNNRLVRGLDYYSHTVFELTTDKLGAQGTVLAGGRYNGLVAQMGGGDVAGIGWACGVERLAMLLENDVEMPRPVAVIPMGEDAEDKALEISNLLRHAGFRVEQSYSGNMKKRMAKAVKANAFKAVIIGSDELAKGEAAVKDLDSGEQKNVKFANIVEEITA
ncbi:MAG: histidine--tRNA ligase [Alphaproteobacteria bacterium]|nr:histidine--tRNA ligase [Alphaproteobacteria bacterium]MDY4689401.1 histidine--tRNA ligase [Alphaproteobacteria bacterium]